MPSKNKYYGVAHGRNPGVYNTWHQCKQQTDGFSNANCFPTLQEAKDFVKECGSDAQGGNNSSPDPEQSSASTISSRLSSEDSSASKPRGQKRARAANSPTPEEHNEELDEVTIAEIVDALEGRWVRGDKVKLPSEMMNQLLRLSFKRRRGLKLNVAI
ncbi:ribonuclease H family protein [Diaporthe eres]|nr:ribonuclease H family protein [Diaporthe eres]